MTDEQMAVELDRVMDKNATMREAMIPIDSPVRRKLYSLLSKQWEEMWRVAVELEELTRKEQLS